VAFSAQVLGVSAPHASASVTKGNLFFDGNIVGTVVTPVSIPGEGTDPFYKVTNGVAGQLGVAGVAPGSPGYHGGHWAVSTVSFHVGVVPYLLTSAAAVQSALSKGDVTVTRAPAADFLCPIQP